MQAEIPTSFGDGRFVVERELGRGGMGVVYEAFDKEREMRVALKTLLHMDSDSLYYFKREFRALHDIVHPNLCSFMELINDEDVWILTMELIQGVDFLSYVKTPDSGFDEQRLRKSFRGLCAGLSALHAAGKVHRDIKPSNVMVTNSGRVVLMDFGLIREREIRGQPDLDGIIGTAAYMAPEQVETQIVSPAADWYSVGVILFEVLTGKLPFDGQPLQIILEKQISDPIWPGDIRPDLPDDLENICFDLLNRDPKSRPNPRDFLNLLEAYSSNGSDSFVNNFTEYTRGEIFVGRNEELKALEESFQKALAGSFQTVIIEGVSGVGKSTLVENYVTELRITNPLAAILRGRCYERESAPFKAFDGVIDSLIHHLRNASEEEARELSPSNIDLLLKLFPSLSRLSLFRNFRPSLTRIEDALVLQGRSFDAFKELLFKLSNKCPLIVIIDDIQWADMDSLSLLKRILGGSEAPPLLVILLCRIAENDSGSALDWDSLVPTTYKRIQVQALEGQDSEELAKLLIEQHHRDLELDAKSIAIEAAGHPLYIAELVQNIESGGDGRKNVRIDEVIWDRVKTLPREAKQVLRTICVAGTPIERGHLQSLALVEAEEFHKTVSILRNINLIRSRGPRKTHLVEPYHDRVREAVIAHDISGAEVAKIHLDIGRHFLKTYGELELKENLFFVVQHLFGGKDLITAEREQVRLAELLFVAGKQARDAAAFVSSLIYFKESIALFSRERWENHYEIMFELYCYTAESAYVSGDFFLTKELVDEAMLRARSNLDRAKIFETYMLSLEADGEHQKAMNEAIDMIGKLGVKLPHSPGKFYVMSRILTTKIRLLGKSSYDIVNLPHNENAQIISAIKLIGNVATLAYLYRPNLNATAVFKSIELNLKHGLDYNSALAFSGWGFINCAILKNYLEGHKYGSISRDLIPLFTANSKNAMTLFVWANFIQHWKEHIRETLTSLTISHEVADRTGDLPYVWRSVTVYCYHSFLAGNFLPETAEHFAHYGKEIDFKKKDRQYDINRMFYQTMLNLMEPSPNPTRLVGTAYNETKMLPRHQEQDQRFNLFHYHFCKLILRIFFESHEESYSSALDSEKLLDAAVGTYRHAVLPFLSSLACLKYHGQAEPSMKRKLLRRVRKNQGKYKKITKACPANHAHKYTLVEAERARVKRKYKKAPALYDQAIAGAIEQQFTQDAALACEFAADFYREIGDDEKTMAYARDALGHYEKWGAFAKVEHVKEKFGID